MSIQFDPPKGLNHGHLGAFWATQRSSLPLVRAAQPIRTTNEVFGNQGQWLPPSLRLALTNEPECRLQMTSSDDQWMCQVQRDRLVVNWRKRSAQYPRFAATWSRFEQAWQSWQAFLVELDFPVLKPRLWDLTYVNRIPKGILWESPSDWPKVLPGLWGGAFTSIEGTRFKGLQGQWVWESVAPVARLYVEPKPGKSTDQPSQDVLLVFLSARGPVLPPENGPAADDASVSELIEAGMNPGHFLIVSTFDGMVSEDAKKAWNRDDGSD